MARQCEVCGKGPQMGNSVAIRGKKKYLGGVGKFLTAHELHSPGFINPEKLGGFGKCGQELIGNVVLFGGDGQQPTC